jgi:hypothetical protein
MRCMPREIELFRAVVLFDIRVEFAFGCHDLLNAVLAYFSDWLDSGSAGDGSSVYVVVKARCAGESALMDHESVQGTHLDIARRGISMHADGTTGRGRCEFPAEAVNSDELLDAINTIVLFLVAHAGRIPIHASAIMLDDTAIVFAGRSGSGKSTLALAASRAGLPVLSDDTVFVQTIPRFRVWSLPRAIHVFEKDAPEGVEAGMRFRSGRWKKVLPIAAPRHMAERALLCVLERGDKVALDPIGGAQAAAQTVANPEPGYEFYEERSATAARALAEGGSWRLRLSNDPAEAIELVRRTFTGIAANQARADDTSA